MIGVGIAGLYQLCELREIGIKVRVFEEGTGMDPNYPRSVENPVRLSSMKRSRMRALANRSIYTLFHCV